MTDAECENYQPTRQDDSLDEILIDWESILIDSGILLDNVFNNAYVALGLGRKSKLIHF